MSERTPQPPPVDPLEAELFALGRTLVVDPPAAGLGERLPAETGPGDQHLALVKPLASCCLTYGVGGFQHQQRLVAVEQIERRQRFPEMALQLSGSELHGRRSDGLLGGRRGSRLGLGGQGLGVNGRGRGFTASAATGGASTAAEAPDSSVAWFSADFFLVM